MAPLDNISIVSSRLIWLFFFMINFLLNAVMVQNKNNIVKEEHKADNVFMAIATSLVPGVAKRLNILPNN